MADDVKNTIAPTSGGFPQGDGGDNDPWKDVQEEVRQRFELLPEDLKKIITDDSYKTHLFNISKALKLTYEEMGILEVETTMVLLGMTSPMDYRDELQRQLKKNDPEIEEIVGAVNEEVFTPVRAALEKIYTDKKEPEDYLEDVPGTPKAPTPQVFPIAQASQAPEATKLTSSEKSVLETSGVVISETPAPIKITPPSQVSTRSDILKAIENPTRSATGIMADKLTGTAPSMPMKTTDYSIPKPTQPTVENPPRSSNDPYREPIR
jgi:hypothetical protein